MKKHTSRYKINDIVVLLLAETCARTENNLCYNFHNDRLSYRDAVEQCRNDGATLVTVTDSAASDLLRSMILENNDLYEAWLGAERENEGSPVWRYMSGITEA